jgi:hypothetical protein
MAQVPLAESARADIPARDKERQDHTHEITTELAYQRLGIVNVIYFGEPNGPWDAERCWLSPLSRPTPMWTHAGALENTQFPQALGLHTRKNIYPGTCGAQGNGVN